MMEVKENKKVLVNAKTPSLSPLLQLSFLIFENNNNNIYHLNLYDNKMLK